MDKSKTALLLLLISLVPLLASVGPVKRDGKKWVFFLKWLNIGIRLDHLKFKKKLKKFWEKFQEETCHFSLVLCSTPGPRPRSARPAASATKPRFDACFSK
jgi:hypothetical protein